MKLHPTTLATWFPEPMHVDVKVHPDIYAATPGARMFHDLALSNGRGIMLRSDGTWYAYDVRPR